ncbi:MAG: antitoxin MazE-like protein [Chloroflexota bacterium]
MRDLTRYRKTLVQERSQEANRVQKLLEGANIKLAAVATNVLGVSGRQMLDAIIAGEEDPAALAEFARASLRKKLPQLRQALEGRVKPHQRLLLIQLLGHIDYLTTAIAEIEQEVERCLLPFSEAVTLLQTIPGIGAIAAARRRVPPVAQWRTTDLCAACARRGRTWTDLSLRIGGVTMASPRDRLIVYLSEHPCRCMVGYMSPLPVREKTMPVRAPSQSSRDKVRAYRERLRSQGLRPVQIWVPDVRSPAFAAEAHRQSEAVAASPHAGEDQAFIDAVSTWDQE